MRKKNGGKSVTSIDKSITIDFNIPFSISMESCRDGCKLRLKRRNNYKEKKN